MFNAITNYIAVWNLYCCELKIYQMSEQGNGAIWWQLHWQLWPSIDKFRFHIYIPGKEIKKLEWGAVLKNCHTFVDLQGFINKNFITKKVAVLKQGTRITFLRVPCPMEIFEKFRQVLRFLVNCLSTKIVMGRREIQRGEIPDYGSCIWRWCYRICQETRETNIAMELSSGWARTHVHRDLVVYEDMEFLSNLDITNIMRSGHVKNCAYKMYWKYITGGCKRIFLKMNLH